MSESIWKKEIRLSRKPKPVAAPAPPPVPAPAPAEPATPWWKKEVSLPRSSPRRRERELERIVHEAEQAVAVSFPAEVGRRSPVASLYEAVVAPAYAEPGVVSQVERTVAPEPVPEPWLTGPVLPPEPEPEVEVEPEPEVVFEPEPVLEVEPEPVLEAEPEPEPLLEPPAAPVAATPFWKKEISFSRTPKAPKPPKQKQEPRPPKPERAPKARKPNRERPRRLRAPRLAMTGRGHAVVGLKIGTSQLAAARISNDTVAELQQVARGPLASGIVVGGELRDPDALAEALKSFFETNRLPRKGVRLGIASPRIGVRIFEVAGIDDEKQLGNAVRFRAQEVLPIPLDESVLDYRVLGESVDDEGRVVKRVLLVVAHRELVDRYVSACRKAGIALSGIDLEAFALLRSLAPPAERNGSALVAVAIGHERTTLAVSDGRVCEFTRVLEWGGWMLNVALARALDSSPSEVESLKRRLSLDGGPAPEPLTPEQAALALDALRGGVESLARELVSSLQFYQGQPGSLGIGEIVITGGTAQLGGLAEELQRAVGVRVRVGNPLNRIRVAKQVDGPDVGSLAVAIGLGIDD